jgi:nitrogen-specific signal transduction histidine kinase
MIPTILQENLATGVLLLNESLEVTWANDSALQILGTTRSQVIGKSFDTWIVNKSDSQYLEALEACLRFGHPFTIRELKLGRHSDLATVDASFSQIPETTNSKSLPTAVKPFLMIEFSQVDNLLKIARDSKYATDENNLKKFLEV